MRSGESGSRGVQENRPRDDSFFFSHDLLGRSYVRQRGQDILPVSFPSGRRHNGCILLKSRKGYLSGAIGVFTPSIPYLQLILLFCPSMGHNDGVFPPFYPGPTRAKLDTARSGYAVGNSLRPKN